MQESVTRDYGDWIVQADLPPRRVEFAQSSHSRRAVPVGITNAKASEREQRLQDLFTFLKGALAKKPVLLRAAGAVSVSATPDELTRISTHPLVKHIERNRRLR